MKGFRYGVALCVMLGLAGCDPETIVDPEGTAGTAGATGGGSATTAGAAGQGTGGTPAQTCVGAVMTIICVGSANEHPDCDGRQGLIRRWCEGTTYMSEFIPAEGAGGAGGAGPKLSAGAASE